jgi:signal transduction histidine kinase/CheY-like chemotaxis protein
MHARPRSIQYWLTWLVIACILPAAVGATILLVRSYQQGRANLELARIGVARALMQVVDGELAGAASVLQVLARSPLIASGDFARFQDDAAYALTTTSGSNVALARRDGGQIINTIRPFGTSLPAHSNAELQHRTFEAGKPVVSDVFIGPAVGRPIVAVEVPVFVNGEATYSLAMGFFPARLEEILLRQKLPPGWVAAIYDRNGTIAARTRAGDQFVGKPGAAAAVRYVAMFPEGAFETILLEGTPVDTVFSHSALSGWAVVIAVPTAMATAELWRSLLINAIGVLGALLLAAAIARRIGQRICRSIAALGEPAQALQSGGTLVLPPIDIIEVDAMRTVLLKAAYLIDQRVHERDAAKDAERRMVLSSEAAMHANRAKSEFIASMSHELRTPLHGILGYAELMRLEGDLTPIQAQRVGVMLGAGKHLLGLINAVLDLSQIEANQLELQPLEIELLELAAACLDVVRPAAEKKGLALVLAPAEPLRLFADPMRLRQVLVNLLGNAVKFTPAGAVEVRLRQVAGGARIRLEVVDTGPGIPAEHRDKLFRSFERLAADALRAVEGAGLGLALSARLATLMGGCLRHDNNPDGGSIFWLEVPRGPVADALSPVAAASGLLDNPLPARHLRVLVVDDVAMNRDIATSFLSAAGHRVTQAKTGEEAIVAAAEADLDVILMDVRMPGMDGLDATRRIRGLQGSRARVPIVALTAQTFTEQVAACREAGMDSHVGKPFDQITLLTAVTCAAEAGGMRVKDLARP